MSTEVVPINQDVTVMHDWESHEVLNKFCDIMNQPGSLFFSRIGGSDYECVRDYFNNKHLVNDQKWYTHQTHSVKSHNGYFDFENKRENFIEYLEAMIECYQNSDAFTYGNGRLINSFEANQFLPTDANFIITCINILCK